MQRRRFKQFLSLEDRLAAWAHEVRKQAWTLPPGPERDALLKKVSHIKGETNSPGSAIKVKAASVGGPLLILKCPEPGA
jgi:hypothetical protein